MLQDPMARRLLGLNGRQEYPSSAEMSHAQDLIFGFGQVAKRGYWATD